MLSCIKVSWFDGSDELDVVIAKNNSQNSWGMECKPINIKILDFVQPWVIA